MKKGDWKKGKFWLLRRDTQIKSCELYIQHRPRWCVNKDTISSCYFARSYGIYGVECDILDKRIPPPFIPECCEHDFYKRLLEIV